MSDELTMRAALAAKLVEARKRIGYIQKTGYNDAQSYSYATAQRVYDKARDVLDELGVATFCRFQIRANDGYKTKSGGEGQRVIVECMLQFVDAATGFNDSVISLGGGSDTGDKAVMKANTSALKYALTAAFLISWGDDPEADTKTDREAGPAPAADAGASGAPKAGGKGKKPTKSQAALADLLAKAKAVQTKEQLDALKLEGNSRRGELAPDDWQTLLTAVRGIKVEGEPAAPGGETK